MAQTYEAISSFTVTTATATQTVTFSSIPQTYTDLRLVASGTTNSQGKVLYLVVNGDTGSNYYHSYMNASSAAFAAGANDATSTGLRLTTSGTGLTPASFLAIADIFYYTNTSYKKSYIHQGFDQDGTGRGPTLGQGFWNSTSAITSLALSTSSGTFNEAVITLYGIKAA